jgi:hypothetical protein
MSRLMLFRGKKIIVYCAGHLEHTSALCGQNAEFYYVKAGGTYSNRWALKGEIRFAHISDIISSPLPSYCNVQALFIRQFL